VRERSRTPKADDGAEDLLRDAAARAVERLAGFLSSSLAGTERVIDPRPMAAIISDLGLRERIRAGGMDGASLDDFLDRYLAGSTRLHHPGFLAHQVAAPHPASAIAELVHGVTDNAMAVYEMGPTATATEIVVVEWMLEKVGWPDGAGVLTHGGSLANLTALLAARAAAAPEAWQEGVPDDLVLLAPPGAHYSIARAASIMGIGSRRIVPLRVDAREVVVPEGIAEAVDRVRGEGQRVLAVVAGACATATGYHDPLRAIGEICRERDVWLHVDGAHGASALGSPRERRHLDGVELADSIVWDAHKMLRVSTLCAAVLFRDPERASRAFHQRASYLFYDHEGAGVDLIHRTVECTKAELGLKLFLVLAHLGEAGMAEWVDGRYAAARRFERAIASREGFTTLGPPEANIVCFRYGSSDAQQLALREALIREGRFYLSSAEVAGVRWLRMVVMSPTTDDTTIERLMEAIERLATTGSGDSSPLRRG